MSYQHREYRPDGTVWVSEFRDDHAYSPSVYPPNWLLIA